MKMRQFLLPAVATVQATAASPSPAMPNMFPKLVPPDGKAWRGACQEEARDKQYDPATWKDTYGKPLHIYRAFPVPDNEELWPALQQFVEDGGILFYSIQPKGAGCWKEAASKTFKDQIKKYAAVVKSLEPHLVMVAAGFEPDGHVTDLKGEEDGYGSAQDYKDMFDNFHDTFSEENVTNAVWVMDFAGERDQPEILVDLWPDGNKVDWLMWNYFQGANTTKDSGRCEEWTGAYYDLLMSYANETNKWADIPWALGAWGTRDISWSGTKPVSLESREDCLEKMMELFADRERYPKLQAQIYFNAKEDKLDDYPTLIQGLDELNSIDTFLRDFDIAATSASKIVQV